MKKNKYILIIALFLGILTSCKDYLEVDQRGKQTLDNYFATETESEVFINGLYRSLTFYSDWWQQYMFITNNMATDDAWMGNMSQDASGNYPYAFYTIDASNAPGNLLDQYVHDYYHLYNCNIAINRLPGANIEENLKQQFIAEAKFLRAFTYWELVQNFGDVVLVTEPLAVSELNLERSPKEVVYAQVVKDLKEAAAVLPERFTSENVGRATKYACQALLARTYLYMKDYPNAYAYADSVIRRGGYQLEPNFVDIWSVYNHNGQESIFEVQTSENQDFSVGNMFSVVMNARSEIWSDDEADKIMDGWGWNVPSSHLEQAYLSEGDEIRRKSTIIRYGEPVYGDEELNPNYQFNIDINKSGRTWRKFYVPIEMRRSIAKKDGHIPLPFVLLRLGEMYLTRAEAAYFNGDIDQAHQDIATIRGRVGLGDKNDLTGNDLLYAIWKERRLEMACEGQRLFDLRREIDPVQNKPMIDLAMGPNGYFVKYNLEESTDEYETIHPGEDQSKGSFFVEGRHELWPIPQSEIDRTNGIVSQNPNY
nr:RagB/SusD family nutrient uptake outer membrane protein [uncultured Carboxylicivirga sp.]